MIKNVLRSAAATVALAAFLIVPVALPGTAARADSGGKPLTVVELYTSLACSICPAADDILASMADRDDVLALSFHVDYWDYTGWADPYADAAFTQRQARYLARLNIPYFITPQVVVDGVYEQAGSNGQVIDELIAKAATMRTYNFKIALTRTGEREVQVGLPAMVYDGQAEVILIRFDAVRQTHVSGGDNNGRQLTNVNVVRQIMVHSVWKGEPMILDVPLENLGGDDLQYYAVIVQEPDQGPILGASYIDLRGGV